MNLQIDGRHGRIALIPLLPLLPAIEAKIEPVIRTQPEQLRFNRILHDGQRMPLYLLFIDNTLPLAAIVGRMKDHRPPVIAPIIIDDNKSLRRIGC